MVVTTSEYGKMLGIDKRTAYGRLERLVKQGKASKKAKARQILGEYRRKQVYYEYTISDEP